MLDFIFSRTTVEAARLLVGFLLVFSGFVKLPDLRGFRLIIAQYGLLPVRFLWLAYTLPFVELLTGGFVLTGVMPVLWAFLALAMMVVSTVFVLYALVKQKEMDDCGCFGVAFKVPLSWWKFAENLVWIALAAVLFWSAGKGI